MATRVAEMTTDDLKELVGELIEQKLLELIGDPDEGLALRQQVRARLARQMKAVSRGERGEPLAVVAKRLGLAQR